MTPKERMELPDPRGLYLEPDQEVPEGFELSRTSIMLSKHRPSPIYLDEYLAQGCALVIRAEEIADDERVGDVPAQGYVWVD